MAEYIEREALINELTNLGWDDTSVIDIVKGFQAADVAPVRHSRWVHCFQQDGETVGQCYECHAIRFVDPYCPNCGAKMDADVETD